MKPNTTHSEQPLLPLNQTFMRPDTANKSQMTCPLSTEITKSLKNKIPLSVAFQCSKYAQHLAGDDYSTSFEQPPFLNNNFFSWDKILPTSLINLPINQ